MIGSNDGREERTQVSSPEPAAITVEDCSLSFGELSVLEDVSLSVEPGEFVGFVGPNGAGKTTLLRLLSGALEPDAGTVTVDGVDVHAVDSKTSSQLVSVVPQDTTLSFSFPVRDVVEMGRHPHRSRFSGPTPADREIVADALERTRTAELAERPIDEVSGGQRQRVVLARAIAQATPAMLLDEPTASLDINHQLETLELVRELVDEGRTVCAAIHDLDLAARYCDRLVMLADGSVFRNGPPADVLTGGALEDVFDASATVTRNPVTGTETVTALPGRTRDELDAVGDGTAGVHVLGTGSTAASVVARLEATAASLELSVGPVTTGDTAAETARDLDVDCLEVPPLESLSPAELQTFERRVRDADVTVVTEDVVESTGAGIGRLLETVDTQASAVVVVTRPDDGSSRGQGDEEPSTTRDHGQGGGLEASPETVLEAVDAALESGEGVETTTSYARFRAVGDDSASSEDESRTGLQAESSSD
ncbi:heme ABC transporter ATP-binding protein [Natronolimnohabitans sp. A-GB9]|uniref:heme ABC transporter ATP-binding protein n=1 Tax=Natronolimnohabitans sp. A-GB9 TaxID=3069757 RepID=UPI0027B81891|nr:heme ABC transporter ATP-binding protein [Natronolimnohabitans sp. A-GB9]MDQ2052287.1 heme ABC transporter ATP-binding protein [Natronolimnohabitans sp. A-GB9]